MKNIMTLTLVMLFAVAVNGFAYDGGTKLVATMTQPDPGEVQFGPIWVVPSHELSPSKTVQTLLYRVPEPTLSIERIREEKPGRTSGTKAVVLFQKRG